MGADLYLESVTNKAREEFEPLFERAVKKRNALLQAGLKEDAEAAQVDVDKYYGAIYPSNGYYRDSYNASALLWAVGFSWWGDITPMLDGGGYLPIEKAKEFVRMLESRPVTLLLVETYMRDRNKERKGTFKLKEKKGWYDRWKKDQSDLLALLKVSIETGEKIRCSL